MPRYTLPAFSLVLAALLSMSVGCASTQKEREGLGVRDPMTLRAATESAVEGIAASPAVQTAIKLAQQDDTLPSGETSLANKRVIIVMDRVENLTSDPTANFQIYLARIRSYLNQSGANRNLAFTETRPKTQGVREREGFPESQNFRLRPRFALTATFYDMPRREGNFFLLTFQLIDFNDDLVAWENSYEVAVRK